MNNRHVIIVAGGAGLRMNNLLPKQFMLLGNKPILMHTIARFERLQNLHGITVALPENSIDYWKQICKKHNFLINHSIVIGGKNRFESVKNALFSLTNEVKTVAIHDGVRPFVSTQLIENLFEKAEKNGNAIACISLKDSIRETDIHKSKAVNRENYKIVQTPQCFNYDALLHCYKSAKHSNFTDDASVFESENNTVNLVEGDEKNIKITTEFDLSIAELILKSGY